LSLFKVGDMNAQPGMRLHTAGWIAPLHTITLS